MFKKEHYRSGINGKKHHFRISLIVRHVSDRHLMIVSEGNIGIVNDVETTVDLWFNMSKGKYIAHFGPARKSLLSLY